ncbi:MAG: hypothetical protein KF817_08890 [Phycisphaeraceae bacterium]|nr:hypothetical protein [Phycisphaeraceae bacterium]
MAERDGEVAGYAYAGITIPNPPSVALHEHAGFVPIGVFPAVGWKSGRWHDVAWFHRRLRNDPPADAWTAHG